jgi:lipopolysaccharide transport system ATP-binding protein
LNRTWAKLRGKPDPYATLVELNDRTQKSESNMVYALKDINFSVNQGEVLGIIGKNGAGKSTLLKILSQITSPTTGTIKMKGRVASLLEVGTGMHPEMTARQNIYLNGSLMGMRRHEITSKLDEIVDFAGIEKYIDTPTKRFSSGMTVRLGFAIAAFLDPEVLIVDEVLAVGDAEFQKKAIGKMQDISRGEGRTVLFVSHSMSAVKNLCNRAIVLNNGGVVFSGNVPEAISFYFTNNNSVTNSLSIRTDRLGNNRIKTVGAFFSDELGNVVSDLISGEPATLNVNYKKEKDFVADDLFLGLTFFDSMGIKRTLLANDELGVNINLKNEQGIISFHMPILLLRSGVYYANFYFAKVRKDSNEKELLDFIERAITFNVSKGDFWRTGNLNRQEGYLQDVTIKVD